MLSIMLEAIGTVQLKGNVTLVPRHALALDVYNVEFYSFATQKSLYT